MQTIWKGSVSFGLVSIPVRLYAATEERDISFRQVHAEDGGRVRYKRVCEKDGEEVAYRDIAKGYELPDGSVVVLTAEDFAALPLPSRKAIEVLQFVPGDQIDAVYMGRAYYLQADGPGGKPYVLLRDALERAGRVAVVKVALRNRESLALLRPREGVLVLQTMLWPDEVRDASFAAPTEDVDVRPQEVAMAESYIDTLSEDFSPEGWTDDYRAALEELVAAKTGDREVVAPEETADTGGTVVDLMAALKASVEAARRKREGGADEPARGGSEAEAEAAPAPRTTRKRAGSTPGAAGGAARTGTAARKTAAAEPAGRPSTRKTATRSGAAPAEGTRRTAKTAGEGGPTRRATKTATAKTAKSPTMAAEAEEAAPVKHAARRKSA